MDSTSITGDGTGIALCLNGSDSISASSITDNAIGIQIMDQADLIIENSTISNNATYNIENLSAEELIATDNWWGTTDPVEIESKVYDHNDVTLLPMVDIMQFVTSIDQIGTPSSIPEEDLE